jgi:glucose/arabinose dehydrogenase
MGGIVGQAANPFPGSAAALPGHDAPLAYKGLSPASQHRCMKIRLASTLLPLVLPIALGACTALASTDDSIGVGPSPQLPAPDKSLVPTVHIAEAVGWPQGGKPKAAAGYRVEAFATGLDHPRWLTVLPDGDVLVAETNAPPKPEDAKGIKGKVMKLVMKRAGAAPASANRITLLRDANGDGVAETRQVFAQGLHSPYGMALVGNELYVADTDAVVKLPYQPGALQAAGKAAKVTDLPAGDINHHWTKNVLASADGAKLYVTVGSNSNVGENGIPAEEGRAAIWEVDRATGAKRLFAGGLRNPNGLAWEPQTHALWTVVNERDELGNDLVPDYLTSVKDGAFYGWPWSYWGNHVDQRVKPPRPEMVAKATVPDYGLGSHRAPLGLAFADGKLQGQFASGAFIGEHGSWNRRPLAGYKVVFVPFSGGKPSGPPVDFLTGFVSDDGKAFGRPVGVAIDKTGAVLVADDVGNTVWRVSPER